MCGRFTIMVKPAELQGTLDLGEMPVELVPNSNISPGHAIPVVRYSESRQVELFRWGLVPSWAKDPKIGYKMFNARAETIDEKPSFKSAFMRRRCLIPADGFYEWRIDEGIKHPYLFTLQEGQPFTFAGLWEYWQDAGGNEIYSCTLITTQPNELVASYHDRMPVILGDEDRWQWLTDKSPLELKNLLKPFPSSLMSTPKLVEKLKK